MRKREQIYRYLSAHVEYELKYLYWYQFEEWLFNHLGRGIGNNIKYDLINLEETLKDAKTTRN